MRTNSPLAPTRPNTFTMLSTARETLIRMNDKTPVVIVRSDEKEVATLREEVETLKARLARRVALDDATISAGYRRYEHGPETPVMALVGHKFTAKKKKAWWRFW